MVAQQALPQQSRGADQRVREALEALAEALSTSTCKTVGGSKGQQASISCPLGTTRTAQPMTAAAPPGDAAATGLVQLDQAQVDAALAQVKDEWRAVGGEVDAVSATVADLPGLTLGEASGQHVLIDVDAAGWGWSTSSDDSSPRMDLLTVVRHEVGHTLGLDHGTGLMRETLAAGESFSVASAARLPRPEPAVEQPAGAVEEPSQPVEEPAEPREPVEQTVEETVEQTNEQTEVGDTTAGPSAGPPTGPTGADAADPSSTGAHGGAGDPGAPADPAGTGWHVVGGVATLVAGEGRALTGTLGYVDGQLVLTHSDGTVWRTGAEGVTDVVVVGGAGADDLTIDLAGLPSGRSLTVTVDGRGGRDSVVVAPADTDVSYHRLGDTLRMSRGGIDVRSRNVETFLDLSPRSFKVDSAGLDLHISVRDGRLVVKGLAAELVLLLGAPTVAGLIDAASGRVALSGSVDWSAGDASLVVRGRHIELARGTSIATRGDISLLASVGGSGSGSDVSSSVTLDRVTLSGRNLRIAADTVAAFRVSGPGAFVAGSVSAVVGVLDSVLRASGAVSLTTLTQLGVRSSGSTAGDGASAGALLDVRSVARLVGHSVVHALGVVTIGARSDVTVVAVGDDPAGAGAAGVSLHRVTRAGIDGAAEVDAARLDVKADASGQVTVIARGGAGGGSDHDATVDLLASDLADVIAGYLPLATAVSFARLQELTEAFLRSGDAGTLRLRTDEGQLVRAYAVSAVDVRANASGSTHGLAAAVAAADLVTRAYLEGLLEVATPLLTVHADTAGEAVARARSAGPGLGLLLVDHDTLAGLADGSELRGASALTVQAASTSQADARVRSDAGAGGAVVLSTLRTRAHLGTGPALIVDGDVLVTAQQHATATASGPQVALVLADHLVVAGADRPVVAGGALVLVMRGHSTTHSVTLPPSASTHPGTVAATAGAPFAALATAGSAVAGSRAPAPGDLSSSGSAPVASAAGTATATATNTADAGADAQAPAGSPPHSPALLGLLVTSVVGAGVATGGPVGGLEKALAGPACTLVGLRDLGRAVAAGILVPATSLIVTASRGPPGGETDESPCFSTSAVPGSTGLELISRRLVSDTSSATISRHGAVLVTAADGAVTAAPLTRTSLPGSGPGVLTVSPPTRPGGLSATPPDRIPLAPEGAIDTSFLMAHGDAAGPDVVVTDLTNRPVPDAAAMALTDSEGALPSDHRVWSPRTPSASVPVAGVPGLMPDGGSICRHGLLGERDARARSVAHNWTGPR